MGADPATILGRRPRAGATAAIALLLAMLAAAPCVQARGMQARIGRVVTPVATLDQVRVRVDWPDGAPRGELRLAAARVDAPDLGYRLREVDWRCALERDGRGGWRCHGQVRAGGGQALRLDLDLGSATTDARLAGGPARFVLHRSAAAPDDTVLELTRVPVAWAQALLATAWADARLTAGTLDGRLTVQAPARAPLRVSGRLDMSGMALETADAGIAGEALGGGFAIDYRAQAQATSVDVDGALRGGQLLFGNTFVSLPDAPVGVRVRARKPEGQGWALPEIAWRDDGALVAGGSATFDADTRLRSLDLALRSPDLAPLGERYLSGQLALAGLADVALQGRMEAGLRLRDGALSGFDLALHQVALRDPQDRFGFEGLDGTLAHVADGRADSALAWRGGAVYGLAFGAGRLPLRSRDGTLASLAPVVVPMLGGTLRIEDLAIRPPDGEAGLEATFALALDEIDFGQVASAAGLPAFEGTLGGRIPRARYADERLDFDGGLSMSLFDGQVRFSSLSLERPFGTAPSLSADIALQDLDLQRLTGVLDVGGISGRLDGRIDGLRLVDWTPVAFDARLRTDAAAARRAGQKQRISQRAVQDISSVGGSSFVGSLQGRAIALFDDFGYRDLGIGCRLANEVCRMSGLEGEGSEGNTFTIVRGAGLPRLDVVGFNRRVDWPTLVERIAAAGKGDVSPVVE